MLVGRAPPPNWIFECRGRGFGRRGLLRVNDMVLMAKKRFWPTAPHLFEFREWCIRELYLYLTEDPNRGSALRFVLCDFSVSGPRINILSGQAGLVRLE